ncbi:MAG TPA: hypothetical protein VEY33_01210 [Gemmatimonadota bacterium]|nr:hypothetical protein [Gemmatimonadota bacterium]
MSGILSIAALVVSAALMAGMVVVLVLLRKGEGPRYSASRAYDANRREAVRVLTGEEVDRVTGEQWFDPARRRPGTDDPDAGSYAEVVAEALEAVIPADRDPVFHADGRVWLATEKAWVLAALSTAELRAGDLDTLGEEGRLVVGLVLFNPEPPGGDAKRVTLPIQVLFPALERVGRGDLVARFEELRERASAGRG